MKNKQFIYQTILPLLAALIWGMAFPVQSEAVSRMGSFTLNAIRFLIGAAVLTVVLKFIPAIGKTPSDVKVLKDRKGNTRTVPVGRYTVFAGFACGTALAAASALQQFGMAAGTSAGKCSFITAMYVVLVPVLGVLLGKKVRGRIWLSVMIAVCGLYFISIREGFSISSGDFLVILSALGFAVQITLIDRMVPGISAVRLARMQFLAAGLYCMIPAILLEGLKIQDAAYAWLLILYMGVMSTAVAYTLQVVSQQAGDAPIVSLLLSMESVFGALGGLLFLHQNLSLREWCGCGLMFLAVILTQIPEKKNAL